MGKPYPSTNLAASKKLVLSDAVFLSDAVTREALALLLRFLAFLPTRTQCNGTRTRTRTRRVRSSTSRGTGYENPGIIADFNFQTSSKDNIRRHKPR